MWWLLFYLLRHIWLLGALQLPFMLLILWAGSKWIWLDRLTGNKRRWVFAWGCLAVVETVALGVFSLVRMFPYIQPAYSTLWAAMTVRLVLYTLHIYNAPLGFFLTVSLDAITDTFVVCGLAALAWWIYVQLTRAAVAKRRHEIALLFSACALGIANRIHSMRPVTCGDCFWPDGFPFTYFHEGGFAGGQAIVWSGLVGDALVVIAVGVIVGWIWDHMALKTANS